MKQVALQDDWAASWKASFAFDRMEVYGELRHRGYLYAYETRRRITLALLADVLPPGATVLDIAAAQGNFSLALAERGYKVTWNDLRSELADYVRLKHERGHVEFAPGNAFELKFPELFDAVLITEVIEHVAHPDLFLSNAAGLVKPGGYVIMTTPNGAYFRNTLPKFSECVDPARFESAQFKPDADGHIFLLHPDEVQPLVAAAGLALDAFVLFTNPLTNGHLKTEPLLRWLPRSVVEGIEVTGRWWPETLQRKLLVQMGARLRKPVAREAS
jgi:2-polyprenyl-3-methyl-5-hydroxy-6-metoxy-1,4-benzoquinol methylase